MAGALGHHSHDLLGNDGVDWRATYLQDSRALHPAGLARPDVQLPTRPDAHREFLDDRSPGPTDLVSESAQAARHSSQESGQQRLHGYQLRHRLLLFRPLLWDHVQASSSLQLAWLQSRHRALRAGPDGASLIAKLQQVPVSKTDRE